MKTLTVNSNDKVSQILIGKYDEIYQKVNIPSKTIYITDENVSNEYSDFLKEESVIVIKPGEVNKTLDTLDSVYNQLTEYKADRNSFIIGFGGGLVTDVAGFAASTFMRGIRFGFIPTSLLAMIDASIGGKNGVNHHRFKNMIGTFNQPDFVLMDSSFLRTLPQDEYISGMGEALKHFLINNNKQFYHFVNNPGGFIDKKNVSNDFLYNQAKVKVEIVNKDEKETGERKKLNFGHTFGHAIEKTTGIKHGFAVSIGMVIAAKISNKLGLLSTKDLIDTITGLKLAGLPTDIHIPKNSIIEAMHKDKKKFGDNIDFIVLEGIGNAKIVRLGMKELEELYMSV